MQIGEQLQGSNDVTYAHNGLLILANPYKFNSIVIGSQDFFNLFTNGKDPDWGVSKHFMFSYVDDKGKVRDIIRNDGDSLSLLP